VVMARACLAAFGSSPAIIFLGTVASHLYNLLKGASTARLVSIARLFSFLHSIGHGDKIYRRTQSYNLRAAD
jgi:hypothetical protein